MPSEITNCVQRGHILYDLIFKNLKKNHWKKILDLQLPEAMVIMGIEWRWVKSTNVHLWDK